MSKNNCHPQPERKRTGGAGQPAYDIPKEKLLKLKELGLTRRKMAESLNVHESTVKRNLKKNGIPLREPRYGMPDRAEESALSLTPKASTSERTTRKVSVVQEKTGQTGRDEVALGTFVLVSDNMHPVVLDTLQNSGQLSEQTLRVDSLTTYGLQVTQPEDANLSVPGRVVKQQFCEEAVAVGTPSTRATTGAPVSEDSPRTSLVEKVFGIHNVMRLRQQLSPSAVLQETTVTGWKSRTIDLCQSKKRGNRHIGQDTPQDRTSSLQHRKKSLLACKRSLKRTRRAGHKVFSLRQPQSTSKRESSSSPIPPTVSKLPIIVASTLTNPKPSSPGMQRWLPFCWELDKEPPDHVFVEADPDDHYDPDDTFQVLGQNISWKALDRKLNAT